MTTDHRIVVSKVLWEQRKVLGLSKGQCKMTNCKYAKFKDGKYFLQSSKKKVIMTSSFDKKNLCEDTFT